MAVKDKKGPTKYPDICHFILVIINQSPIYRIISYITVSQLRVWNTFNLSKANLTEN